MKNTHIKQVDNLLYIDFKEENVNKLYIKNKFHSIAYEPIGDTLGFQIDLNDVLNDFKDYTKDSLFLIVEKSDDILTTQRRLKVNNKVEVTNLNEISDGTNTIYPYITKGGFLNFTMKNFLLTKIYFSRRHIDNLKFNNSQAIISGEFSIINSNIQSASLLIGTRLTEREKEISLPISLIHQNNKKQSSNFKFSTNIYEELINFMKYPFDTEDVIDLYLKIYIQETLIPIKVKIGNPRILVERFLKGEIITNYQNEIVSIYPYFTMKGRNLSFYVNRYSINNYLNYIQELQNNNGYKNLKSTNEKIWVIGERSYKAQDNGYHFFKYMRTQHPNLPVYYIIDRNSNEAKNVERFGNVIYYGTPEHFSIILQADYICSTHDPEFLYPINNYLYKKKVRGTKVFLQHGVLGTKNLKGIYGNQLKDFNIDLFITSSEREKEIVVKDLKYDETQVKVTGLPRFDELFDLPKNHKNQILIIPTWRDWLNSYERVQSSEYLERYNSLLNSSKIKEISDKGIDVVFCLHANMQYYSDLFDIPSYVTSIKQGDVDVQKLIKESALMVTDYSSVAFDFSFLNKPVIYYQFDKDQFLGRNPSHIDVENELPGHIVNTQDNLEYQLTELINNNYKVSKNIKDKAKRFCKYNDQGNSERIYKEVINFNKKTKVKNKLKQTMKYDILSQHLYKKFRKNKNYFNFMDKYNTIISTLMPIKKDLIVFESNVGKSVSDSPKVIYDKLKEYNNQYQIVWVNNKQYPFNDPNVISVKRLSPEYYYYLSRAKFWINNQNFPHYITKPKDTVYIQTWHGTPLKKMLNDVDHFAGKDSNYKKRVNKAIKYWDYLVSPSFYASECFRSAFEFHKEILEVGYPRNDIFYNKDKDFIKQKEEMIKQKLGIQDERKVILYAPTFRDDEINKAKKHVINLQLDLHQMKEQLSSEYILILRPHVIISNALQLDSSLDDFVINGSNYNDISDLFLISDICITDYSSVMFDYANTKKPILFFTYDFEYYKDSLRGFYFDFENEAPGPLIKTNDELVGAIKNIDKIQDEYEEKYNQFYDKFCSFESGNAANNIVNKFFN